jgi:hypothetical protein
MPTTAGCAPRHAPHGGAPDDALTSATSRMRMGEPFTSAMVAAARSCAVVAVARAPCSADTMCAASTPRPRARWASTSTSTSGPPPPPQLVTSVTPATAARRGRRTRAKALRTSAPGYTSPTSTTCRGGARDESATVRAARDAGRAPSTAARASLDETPGHERDLHRRSATLCQPIDVGDARRAGERRLHRHERVFLDVLRRSVPRLGRLHVHEQAHAAGCARRTRDEEERRAGGRRHEHRRGEDDLGGHLVSVHDRDRTRTPRRELGATMPRCASRPFEAFRARVDLALVSSVAREDTCRDAGRLSR